MAFVRANIQLKAEKKVGSVDNNMRNPKTQVNPVVTKRVKDISNLCIIDLSEAVEEI